MNSMQILDKTKKLLSEDREKKHGNKIINHLNISRLWSSYLQNKFKLNLVILPEDAANLMALLKIARTQAGEYNEDDYIDSCGYAAIAGEIAHNRKEISTTLGERNAKTIEKSNNT